MINRVTRTALDYAQPFAGQQSSAAAPVRDLLNIIRTTARHSMTFAGCTAVAILAVLFVKPDLTEHVKALSPFGNPKTMESANVDEQQLTKLLSMSSTQLLAAPVAAAPALTMASAPAPSLHLANAVVPQEHKKAEISPQQQRVTTWIAKRYRVAKDATNMLVSAAYSTAKEIKIDPLLILAVMAIESRFNPFAESPVGAQGLMQVMSKVHKEKFEDHGGVKAALNPVANIKVGSLILKDYVRRGGSVEAGLKMYVGAAAFETDSGYGSKVLAEYQKLKDVAGGKKVPTITTASRPVPKRVEEPKTEEALLEKQPEFVVQEQPA
ncbi:transglycosylase SLT domain-containing protein [Oxalobacteraceae bacterium R-40]|uniref:Transglycosylase SLT domain-containing protein n=1 Tax=Keguizhuia sedimenti TaxID=3064264 RepID=A0ABU1BL83_9BURK|nr:transglycosylase SLT domain-containing protein [Oxalobacteraceae bacterium R-40]